jgi:4-hydroxy-2-oxoheptanedioate aldolase
LNGALAPRLRQRLDAGETVLVGWMSQAEPALCRVMARAGCDAVVVDLQHSAMSRDVMRLAVLETIRAGAAPVVRAPYADANTLGSALDAGAEGVIAPMIDTVAEARALVRATKFPPLGQRSWASEPVSSTWGLTPTDLLARANDWTVTFAMVETRTAIDNLRAILDEDGVDAVFIGPNDLSIALTDGREVNPAGAETLRACEAILRAAQAKGKHAGIYANTLELARRYRDMGFRFIAIGNEAGMLMAGARQAVDAMRP